MPPTEKEFRNMFDAAMRKLKNKIRDRENANEWVDNAAKRGRDVAFSIQIPIMTEEGRFDFKFEIHADTACSAINEFVKQATFENVSFATGEKGGKLLGVDGKNLHGFYAYKAI